MGTTSSAATEWRRFWFLPLAAALGYATSVIHVYALGPFIGPLTQEFGWSRAQISAGLTISALVSAAACIPVGMLVDRVGPRRVGLVGVLAMTAAFALLSTATGQFANWLLLWAVIAVGTFWVQATVWTSAVASRFERSRGLAFAITLSGASIAATVFPLARDFPDRFLRLADSGGGHGRELGRAGIPHFVPMLSWRSRQETQRTRRDRGNSHDRHDFR